MGDQKGRDIEIIMKTLSCLLVLVVTRTDGRALNLDQGSEIARIGPEDGQRDPRLLGLLGNLLLGQRYGHNQEYQAHYPQTYHHHHEPIIHHHEPVHHHERVHHHHKREAGYGHGLGYGGGYHGGYHGGYGHGYHGYHSHGHHHQEHCHHYGYGHVHCYGHESYHK